MSTLGVILLIVGGVLLVLLIGGFVAIRRIDERREADAGRHIAEADRALEQARASDKGWDRELLEAAAREALGGHRPGWHYDELALVLVDDRPGIEHDRAHLVATGNGDNVRVILARTEAGWSLEQIQ